MNYDSHLTVLALEAAKLKPALAYIGPGLGLGVIGAFFGILFSIVVAIFAFFWYPLKRWLGLGKKKKNLVEAPDKNDQNVAGRD